MNKRGLLFLATCVLTISALIIWFLVLYPRPHHLTVSFLDVGQGDAIFIESPTGTQVLIDGGRDRSVLRELGKKMNPLDRTIDVMIATHPDSDHIGGLPHVLERYKVSEYVSTTALGTTETAQMLEAFKEREKGLETHYAQRGQRISIGGGAYVLVLFPDRDVRDVESNTGSVVLMVVYGDTSVLLSGDSPTAIEDWLVALDGPVLQSEVLKAGHHGSRTSTSEAWLSTVAPTYVVISAGEHNSYGHPHDEVVTAVTNTHAELVYTYPKAVTFASDGVRLWKK